MNWQSNVYYIQPNDGDNIEVSESEAILLSIDMFKALNRKKYESIEAVTEYSRLKRSLIKLLNQSQWQTIGSLLSDKEGLDRAYTNNQNLRYDGNQKIYTAGTNSLKDFVINDLTIPLRVLRYTERYKQAHHVFTNNKDNIKTAISHSLGSVIAHHIIVDNKQLNGRLYSTPSLAIPHDRRKYCSHHGDPIAMFKLDRTIRKLYLGNPHTYTGY